MLSTMMGGVLFLFCAFACVKDMSSLTIPNWVNAGIALAFLPAAAIGIATSPEITIGVVGWHLLVGFITFIVCFILFTVGAFGGGDAKMIPAVALWMGPYGVAPFMLGLAAAGGVLALAVLYARKTIPEAFAPGFVRATMQEGEGVPYGLAISAGAVIGGMSSPFLTNFLSLFISLN